ncbi:uncharacterized protein LOC134797946 isoform X2 [Cydia splendana]|uniref:uncharacterized protein LOC134797946 isoform X2 n=1 Tax=Cydia splendana TaxID=1100963 RepID=UPI00300C398D
MHAAAARYVSVSELYSTDEVELLLDEIRDLEPTSCRGEDIQDFEIAGSGLGATAGSGARSPGSGSGSGAGTERSWDSHAHYRRAPPPPPRPLAPVYCRCRHLLTKQGAAMLFITLCSLGCASCVWAGAGLQVWALPGAGRVRLLQLGAVTSTLLHLALLLLRITSLDALLPLRWDKLGLAVHAWSGSTLLAGGAGSLHALLQPEYRLAPTSLMALLYTASGLGLSAACLCLTLVGLAVRLCAREAGAGRAGSSRSARAAYRAVPAAPAAPQPPQPPQHQPVPSTSRQNPL